MTDRVLSASEAREAVASWRRQATAMLSPGGGMQDDLRTARLQFANEYADAIDRLLASTDDGTEVITVRKFAGHIIGATLAIIHDDFCRECSADQLHGFGAEMGRAFALGLARNRERMKQLLPGAEVQ